jgi:hypothetical protein
MSNLKKFIVTTTINAKTKALELFDNMDDWTLIVVGDKKTPDIKIKNGYYVPPDQQSNLGFRSVAKIPWNVIQRRNIAYLLALKEGADIIATIDDDNIPFSTWGEDIKVGQWVTNRSISDTLVCDPLYEHSNAVTTKLWHRGFPVQLLEKRKYRKEKQETAYVDVQACLWNGDPDVDAVCRLSGGPFDVEFSNTSFFIDNNTFAPFNTQNTLMSRRATACMCLPFDIGRMDDIWASYMTQRVLREFDGSVLFTGPTVYQDRNDHDLTKDLEKEVIGYRNTVKFLQRLNEIDVKSDDVLSSYSKVINGIQNLEFISKEMISFQRSWLDDVSKIL